MTNEELVAQRTDLSQEKKRIYLEALNKWDRENDKEWLFEELQAKHGEQKINNN